LFRDDNATVYFKLEEATRLTTYAASIKPFQQTKDGRGSWFVILNQYAGKDKWEAEIKRQEQLLHTRVWKGQSNFTLEAFISQHRNAHVSLQQCAGHVQYQLPNEHSRVRFVLESIQCSDAGLQAAMASVRTDNGPNGLRNDFEAMAAHLLPYDPVAKKHQATGKCSAAMISGVNASEEGTTMPRKDGVGKTGVHFCFHTSAEYEKLMDEQRFKLREWRDKEKAKGRSFPNSTKSMKKKKSSKKGGKNSKTGATKPTDDDADANVQSYIASLVKEQVDKQIDAAMKDQETVKKPAAQASMPKKAMFSALRSILKKAKNDLAVQN
jgi:hypothetical protein